MSFTIRIKKEISQTYGNKTENMAELSGILRNSYETVEKIEIITENSTICKHIYTLFKDIYQITVNVTRKNNHFNRNRLYVITIPIEDFKILKDLSVIDDNKKYLNVVNSYILGSEDEKRAYLKGVFLISGSINDPKTSMYHLELFINYLEEAEFISNLLNEFNLNSRVIKREKGYMVYIKEAEKIGDFLRIIKANAAVMYFEDIRIYRDHKNMTNRLNNCEQANIEKIINTSMKQIDNINLIKSKIDIDLIDKKIYQVMEYRLKYPETSIQELSEIMSLETGKEITKSGLNHRFRKIKEMAERLK